MNMTKREFYQNVANAALTEEMTAFALAELGKLDKANENRKTKDNEKASEFNAAATAMIEAMPLGVTMNAVEFGALHSISTQKASAVLRRGVELSLVSVEDVKVQGKGKMKGYTRFDAASYGVESDEDKDEVTE